MNAPRLKTHLSKILNHVEWCREKLWAHHSTAEYQATCRTCFRYAYQYAKWDRKLARAREAMMSKIYPVKKRAMKAKTASRFKLTV